MANRKKSGRELGTQANFKLKGGIKPIRKFDDSDLVELRNTSAARSTGMNKPDGAAVVPRAVPSHLLMISILEHLCYMYTRSGTMAHKLFKVLCEQLTKLHVVSPLSCIDEMIGIRAHYRSSVHNMIQAAMDDLYKKGEILALPPTMEFHNMKLNHQLTRVRTEDLINMQTSRYGNEFIEKEKLGKGGFGSVYKVQNRLDGRNYAVKKIKFKHKKPEHLLKVLKEVKALANFQHTNIVGYNAAWLEYDFPSVHTSRSSSSLTDHDISQDKSFSNIPEVNSHNVDVEFQFDSGSEDELTDGKILHKHFNQSTCKITEITEFPCSPPKHNASPKKPKNLNIFSPKSKNIPNMEDNLFNVRYIDAISGNVKEKGVLTTDIEQSESSDIIFLEESDDKQSSNSKISDKLITQELNSQDILETDSSESENPDSLKTSAAFSQKVLRKRDGHVYKITGSTNEVNIPKKNKDDNTIPNSSPKDRLVPFRRSISAEPLSDKNVINDFQDYSDDNFPYQATVFLYIQMELCEQTLQMWLYDRNSRLDRLEDLMQYKEDNMKIIHQILTGVDYIHSLGLIHRDLKPRNIFLLGNNLHIKIGDFGLATENVVGDDIKDTILTPSPDIKAFFKYDNLTSGVGTLIYAAPEQLVGNYYDSKSDIYSIGVILFEEFQVFKTEMERHISIKGLRDGTIPDLVKQYWPNEAKAIQAMTCVKSSERPTAKYLLDSQLFLSQDQIIGYLKKQLSEQTGHIALLQKQLQEKTEENFQLKRQLEKAEAHQFLFEAFH